MNNFKRKKIGSHYRLTMFLPCDDKSYNSSFITLRHYDLSRLLARACGDMIYHVSTSHGFKGMRYAYPTIYIEYVAEESFVPEHELL